MPTLLISFVVAVMLALQSVPAASQIDDSAPITYEATVIETDNGMCPTAEESEEAQDRIRAGVERLLGNYTCGGTSGWGRIAHLDMSDSSQQCPGDFREIIIEGIRLCARDSRADTEDFICTSVTYPSGGIPYSEVCGRVVAYQTGSAAAFRYNTQNGPLTIDEYYVDGVTLTHGPVGAREHIWTFVTELQQSVQLDTFNSLNVCPCATTANPSIVIPPFIGDDYFCDSGTLVLTGGPPFYNNPLWDGVDCREDFNMCCRLNNPPFFTRQLPASTSDDIELQDCGLSPIVRVGQGFAGDTLIHIIELYVR